MNDLVHRPAGAGGAVAESRLVSDGMVVTAAAVRDHVNVIVDIMNSIMKEDVHYGVIPGMEKTDKDGKDIAKRTLFKPGAEKLCLAFQLAPEFKIEKIDLPGGHREYSIVCALRNSAGRQIAECIGVCTSMEGKYRFRSDISDVPVPQAYWDKRDPALLGGPQFYPKKKSGKWYIAMKVEHDNPADYYNTIAKMALKRAHVGATILATGASDVFDQDIEDLPDEIRQRDDEREGNDQEPKGRPGQQAGQKAQATNDPDRRKKLVDHVEGLLKKGTPLAQLWAAMLKDDRLAIGKDEWERLRKDYPEKPAPTGQPEQPAAGNAAAQVAPASGGAQAQGQQPAAGDAAAGPASTGDPAADAENARWLKDFEGGGTQDQQPGREPGAEG